MSFIGFKSVVYDGDSCLGELEAIPVKDQSFLFPNNEIRIHHLSPRSERCLPISVLQTISPFSVLCKLESKSTDKQPHLLSLHSTCFDEQKTAVVLLGEEEIHLVAMSSKQKNYPCFWCYSARPGLYNACLGMFNLRCLSIVFDLDETLIVANTMKSFEDRIEVLQSWISKETDHIRAAGMTAEMKRYIEGRAFLEQYKDNDSVVDNGKVYTVQAEEVPKVLESHPKRNLVSTRINPETASSVPVLCVARNVKGGFFKEFDEKFLRRISEIFYEDEVVNLPLAPDVSNYLMPEFSDQFTDAQTGERHAELCSTHESISDPTQPKRNPTLPPSMIIDILARCERKDQVRFRCVCKCWNALLRHPLFRDMCNDRGAPLNFLNIDIIEEILLTLSLKDVIRFGSVSTFSWDVITDADFIKRHSEANRLRASRIMCNNLWDADGGRSFVLLHVQGPPIPVLSFNKNSGINFGPTALRQFSKGMILAGSMDGLVCLTNNDDLADSLIALWNPTTNWWKLIQLPRTKSWKHMSVGLAFDSEEDNYKIICIVPVLQGGSRIEIYSCRERLWVEAGSTYFSPAVDLNCACVVKGLPYWIGKDREEQQIIARVRPNGVVEIFEYPRGIDKGSCHFLNREDSVTLLVQIPNIDSTGFVIDLYVMETDGTWTRFHSVASFTGDLMMAPQCMGTGEIVMITYDKLFETFYFNPQSGQLLHNDDIEAFFPCWYNSYSYSESLVQVDGMAYMESDKESDMESDMEESDDRAMSTHRWEKWGVFLPEDYESALNLY